jgi:hypothetical protein
MSVQSQWPVPLVPTGTHPCVAFEVGEQMQLHDDVPWQTDGMGSQ